MPSFFKSLRGKSSTNLRNEVVVPTKQETSETSLEFPPQRQQQQLQTDEDESNGSQGTGESLNTQHPPSSTTSMSNPGTPAPDAKLQIPKNFSFSNLSQFNKIRDPETSSQRTQSSNFAVNGPQHNRRSSSGVFSSAMANSPRIPTSQYAPRVLSITENSWLPQRAVLIYGQCGDPTTKALDGTITVTHHLELVPQTTWPVVGGHFKLVVYLLPGPNDLRLDFSSSKLAHNGITPALHSTRFRLNNLTPNGMPPLHLILVSENQPSEGAEDLVKEKIGKIRTGALLWQTYIAEQMYREGLGRRSFRFEDEWTIGTSFKSDAGHETMRTETRVQRVYLDPPHAQSDHTTSINHQDLQNKISKLLHASHTNQQYALVFMDRPSSATSTSLPIISHNKGLHMALFEDDICKWFPADIDNIVPALTDCSPIEGPANSMNRWEEAAAGLARGLKAISGIFGGDGASTSQSNGESAKIHRTFLMREAFSASTKQTGLKHIDFNDEKRWPRLDLIKFRFHPLFRTATEPSRTNESAIQLWPIDQGRMMVTARSGITLVELYADGETTCSQWIEHTERDNPDGPPRQITITESALKGRFKDKKVKTLRVVVHSASQGVAVIDDFSTSMFKDVSVKMRKSQLGFYGPNLGQGPTPKSTAHETLLISASDSFKLLLGMKVYHSSAVHGIEFFFEGNDRQLFGTKGGEDATCSDFPLETRQGETLLGFSIRSDFWIEAIQIMTTTGRKSEFFGSTTGGTIQTLIPPRGYCVGGLRGSDDGWLDSLSMVITRGVR